MQKDGSKNDGSKNCELVKDFKICNILMNFLAKLKRQKHNLRINE